MTEKELDLMGFFKDHSMTKGCEIYHICYISLTFLVVNDQYVRLIIQ